MESTQKDRDMRSADDTNYECHHGQTWIKTLDDSELLIKFFDSNVKEELEPKKIKDE